LFAFLEIEKYLYAFMIKSSENFKKFILQLTPISNVEFESALNSFEDVKLKKGDNFVSQNEICNKIAFVNKGIFRIYHISENGEERTTCFCSENNIMSSYKSFSLQLPSELIIEALEDSEIIIINYNNLQKLFENSKTWQYIGRILTDREYIEILQYASVLSNENAKEKYLRFIKEQPKIIQRVPVQFIASYLGVTRRTLSRIRSEIVKNK
jgi:CRP-like cAMP-binding protein